MHELEQTARRLMPSIAEGAAYRERERILPFDEVRALAAAGLGTWRVPAAFGGPDAGTVSVFDFIMDLAAADANVAQSVRSHFAFVELLRRIADPATQKVWFDRVLAGEVFATASGETGGPQGRVNTRVYRGDDRWLLTGTKFYCTGALFADWITVKALDDSDVLRVVVVPAHRAGVECRDDWDGMGQRLTASGTTVFTDVVVDDEEFVDVAPRDGELPSASPFLQLFLAALETGIARSALHDAIAFAQKEARPIRHSEASRSVDDPYIRQAVGDMSARVYGCEATVRRAAATLDDATLDPAQVSLDVAQAHYFVVETALRVTETMFEVGGASTTRREYNFDRHWRNARTLANHNPRAHKASVVGANLLTGQTPPTSGYF